MNISWIFLNRNKQVEKETLDTTLPHVGDGKIHNMKGYEVIFVGENLVSQEDPIVLAVEQPAVLESN